MKIMKKGGAHMGDIVLLVLIFLMVSYTFWDELFTD